MTDHSPPSGSLAGNPFDIARFLLDEDGKPPKGLPPVHRWNPPFCGDLDMVIKRNGQWFYMGTPIGRLPLVKLFSTILRRDDDDQYYLITPVEKVRIQVEDAPFLAVDVDRVEEGGEVFLRFTMQTGDRVIAGPDHPIWVEYHDGEPSPYVHLRDRLHALISRPLFYRLVESGEMRQQDGQEVLGVTSSGQFFEIGRL
jgi:hypothetical protein